MNAATWNCLARYNGYANGDQRRDFVSVENVVEVLLHFFEHPEKSGIFNLGADAASL